MPCYKPLLASYGPPNPVTGVRAVVFGLTPFLASAERLELPCGQCIGCRLERSRQWAVRCMHEASLYPDNCFITLTYDDVHLPTGGSLDRAAFPKFMKRLRKSIAPRKVRFYHAGEYGATLGRPHYHACLFGYDFPDKREIFTGKDYPAWTSDALEQLWPFGRHQIDSVTFESAAYVARYVVDKITGDRAEAHYAGREPEYATMSRRPGIGMDWLGEFGDEVHRSDAVVMRGREMKPPRAYDKRFELVDPEAFDDVRAVRRVKALERLQKDGRPSWVVKRIEEAISRARLNLYGRGEL